MTYHSTRHPIRRFFGLRGLGAIDQAATDSTGMYVTSLTPYDVSQVQAQYVPSSVIAALNAAGFPRGYVSAGWSDAGHVWVKFMPGTGMTDAARQAALTASIRAAERTIGGGAKLLLPGESAPAGSTPATAPPGTTMTAPPSTSMTTSSGSVALPATQLQNFLIGHGFDIGSASADGVFGTNSVGALNLALAAAGKSPGMFAVSGDKHTVTVQMDAWNALATLPTRPPARRGGGVITPIVVPGGTTMPGTSTGPDWGAIAPWIVGSVALAAIGGYFAFKKKKPRTTHTLRNRRVRRNPDFNDMIVQIVRHPAGLSWIETQSGYNGDDLVYEDSNEWNTEKQALESAVNGAQYWLSEGVNSALVIDSRGNEYWSGSKTHGSGYAKGKGRKTKRNPIPHGYSRKTMGKIIGIERRAGRSRKQAAAIAYSVARKAAKRAHTRPRHLRSNRSRSVRSNRGRTRRNPPYIADAHRRAWAEKIGGYLSQWQGPGSPAINHVASYLLAGEEVTRERVSAAADEMERFIGQPDVRAQDKRGGKTAIRALRKFARGVVPNNGTGYELVYSTGGHGGPYPDVESAKEAAERLLRGGRDRWIGVIPASQITDLHSAQAAWIARRDETDGEHWEKGPTYLPFSYFRGVRHNARRTDDTKTASRMVGFDTERRSFRTRDAMKAFLKKEHLRYDPSEGGAGPWRAAVKDVVDGPNMVAWPSYQEPRRGVRHNPRFRSYDVRYFIETRSPSGGMLRDSWLPMWGAPSSKKLVALLRKSTVEAGSSARVVAADGTVVVPWRSA